MTHKQRQSEMMANLAVDGGRKLCGFLVFSLHSTLQSRDHLQHAFQR